MDQFFCNRKVHYPIAHYFYLGKLILTMVLYTILYSLTYYVDKKFSFRGQYNILVCLKISVIFSRLCMTIFKVDLITTMPIHYIDCLTNLITGLVMFKIYY